MGSEPGSDEDWSSGCRATCAVPSVFGPRITWGDVPTAPSHSARSEQTDVTREIGRLSAAGRARSRLVHSPRAGIAQR